MKRQMYPTFFKCLSCFHMFWQMDHLLLVWVFFNPTDHDAKCLSEFIKSILQTVEAYPFLDKFKLKTELLVTYKRNDFKNMSEAVNLLKFFIENQLLETLSEISILLKIVITIHMTTAEAERTFSTQKWI